MASSLRAARNNDEMMSLSRSNALFEVASLFSAFHFEKELEIPHVQEFSSVIDDDCFRELVVSCPCLSLHHEKDTHRCSSNHCVDRKHAEDHAVCLLARPLKVFREDKKQDIAGPKVVVARTARALVKNIHSSFAVLVDSRLHAYTEFLARHALALTSKKFASDAEEESGINDATVRGLEEKLTMILATGCQIEADTFGMRFELQKECSDLLDCTKSSAMLNFAVEMDFLVPRPHGKKEMVPVSFSTTGKVTGTFCSETNNLDAVEIDLDTRHLLTNMVQQATRVVSAAVEIASNSCNNGKHQLSRSASFLAMPPPNVPVKHHTVRPQFASFLAPKSFGSAGLELLSITAAGLPIVSPDLSGSGKPLLAVHDFDLEADKDDSSLSFDQCVDIIDTCLLRGDFSDVSERFRKKTKIEG